MVVAARNEEQLPKQASMVASFPGFSILARYVIHGAGRPWNEATSMDGHCSDITFLMLGDWVLTRHCISSRFKV